MLNKPTVHYIVMALNIYLQGLFDRSAGYYKLVIIHSNIQAMMSGRAGPLQ